MKLSAKSRYGIRGLLDIAMHSKSSHIKLSDVAKRQEISLRYFEQVASDLRKAGYIYSKKGAHGGYGLAIPATQIYVSEILKVLEGDIRFTDKPSNRQTLLQQCIEEMVYEVLNDKIADLLNSTTLQKMLDDYLEKECAPMYYI